MSLKRNTLHGAQASSRRKLIPSNQLRMGRIDPQRSEEVTCEEPLFVAARQVRVTIVRADGKVMPIYTLVITQLR
jgi:hypothetical protein